MIELAACLAWPAPVETPTMRATGIGTHPTNEDGEKNRCATALRVGERARGHLRWLAPMGPVIESCTRLTPR